MLPARVSRPAHNKPPKDMGHERVSSFFVTPVELALYVLKIRNDMYNTKET
jgi:hypothetical protein